MVLCEQALEAFCFTAAAEKASRFSLEKGGGRRRAEERGGGTIEVTAAQWRSQSSTARFSSTVTECSLCNRCASVFMSCLPPSLPLLCYSSSNVFLCGISLSRAVCCVCGKSAALRHSVECKWVGKKQVLPYPVGVEHIHRLHS